MKKKYKTKFPVIQLQARIKKIMQMDEDVGKVAQATPILISKALELFMQSLIDQACVETRARNAKRLTVAHLKKTVQNTEQFDFLKDVVAEIPDPAETNVEEVKTEGDAKPARAPRASASRRKPKKEEDEDEFIN